jgi:hypothetical protein
MRCLQTNTKLKTADKSEKYNQTPAKSARQGNLRRVGDFPVLHFCRCYILYILFTILIKLQSVLQTELEVMTS